MIFYSSLFFSVVLSWIVAMKIDLNEREWLLILFLIFLGLWSGMHFWSWVAVSLFDLARPFF